MFEQLKENYRRADQLKALDLLHDPSRYPALRELNSGDFRLQLYLVPSFEPYVSWSLFIEKEGDYTVRRVRWDCAADYYLEMGYPTIYGTDTMHRAEDIEPWLDKLTVISFPPFNPKNSFGIDGTTFGLRCASFAQSTEVSWWCEPPAGWENLAEWYQSFVAHLESRSPAHTDRQRVGIKM